MDSPDSSSSTKKLKNDEDRISKLPEPVLHHILSFLDMKHVVQTSVFSRPWRYVWKSLPFLNFNSNLFSPKCFTEFVDHVLKPRENSCNLQTLRLYSQQHIDHSVYRWILAASRRSVQELYLDVYFHRRFLFPNNLFTCESLRVLELKSCFHILEIKLPDSMSLPCLKTLILRCFRLWGDNMTNKILTSCPVLESLTLIDCIFEQANVNISALQLKHLVIECNGELVDRCLEDYSVNVYAPNLLSFRCKDILLISADYSIHSLSALVKADIDMGVEVFDEKSVQRMMKFLRSLQNVEDLTLSARCFEVLSGFPGLLESDERINFCNLRCLKLSTLLSTNCIMAITYLLKISPNIEYLLVDESNEATYGRLPMYVSQNEIQGNVSLQCMLYHLKVVEIRGVQGFAQETLLLEILLKNTMVLENLVLYTSKKQSPLTERRLIIFTDELLSLPRASPNTALSLR